MIRIIRIVLALILAALCGSIMAVGVGNFATFALWINLRILPGISNEAIQQYGSILSGIVAAVVVFIALMPERDI